MARRWSGDPGAGTGAGSLWLPRGQPDHRFMSAPVKLKLLIEYKLQSRHWAEPDELSWGTGTASRVLDGMVWEQRLLDCQPSSWFTVT